MCSSDCGPFILCCACLLLWTVSALGGEDEPSLAAVPIDVDGPAACVNRQDVISKVTAVVGDVPAVGSGPVYHGRIIEVERAWVARLEVEDESGRYERSVSVRSCEAAVDVLSLLIALAVDPVAVLASDDAAMKSSLETLNKAAAATPGDAPSSRPGPGSEKESATEESADVVENAPAPAVLAAPAASVDEKKDADRRQIVFTLGADFVGDIGFVDVFRPGVSLFGTIAVGRFHATLSARYLPPAKDAVHDVAGAKIQSQLAGVSLGAGVFFRFGAFRISPMAGAAVHGLFAQTDGVTTPGDGKAWFSSLWLGVSLEWIVANRYGVRFFPSIHYLPERPRFEIQGVGTVIQPYAAAANLNWGIFFQF